MGGRSLPLALIAAYGIATAAEPAPAQLDRVQVTATRLARDLRDTPAAVTVIDRERLQTDTAGLGLSEKLVGVPGVLARSRQNYAQDEQISIRGFGTRASFGIRSVRLYVDGIPATMPDGQGQVSHFPLAEAERIEVLRGPFAALYGNGAGGVVQLFTADGADPSTFGVQAATGSFGLHRIATNIRGIAGDTNYAVGASHVGVEGWRDHSRARRSAATFKLRRPFAGGEITLLGNLLVAPDAQDPQGLTRAQVDADPRQASAGALRFNTRKSVRQAQLGAVYERALGASSLRVLGYGGHRRVEQVLSTPAEAQRSPLSAGGWIDLSSPFAGIDARWSHRGAMASRPLEVIAGVAMESQRQARRGYENFIGTVPGVQGRLRQQQDDRVDSFDPYLQANWKFAAGWSLDAGVRASRVSFQSQDRYIVPGNPDDSGRVRHRGVSPAVGLNWRATPSLSLYTAVGRSFETPTFNELGYRSDGRSGPNFALEPMRSRNSEVGLRFDDGRRSAELAAFRADTDDELVVNTSVGGRTTFRNAGRSRRQGVEAGLRLPLGEDWRVLASATWLDARFRDAFVACVGTGCSATAPIVRAGTTLPGVPRLQAHAALRRGGDTGWHVQADAQHVGGVGATTAGDVRTRGYTLAGITLGYGFAGRGGDGRAFAGVSNLFDRRHVGSVIVNDANGRYFEPGAGRAFVVGIEWTATR